ncbi:MAG: SIS domain-containing protein [Bacteroidales bacterium]
MTGGGDKGGAILEAAFEHTIRLHRAMLEQDRAPLLKAASAMRAALASGRKVLALGNGGSASDAQHFAAELVGRFLRERRALPAIALTVDTSILTAVGNDYGFEKVFARQVEALAVPGDVALGISTSGRSPNVLEAFAAARARQVTTVALTGCDGGPIGQAADIHINVPDRATPRVQEVHRTLLHVICELIEEGV